MMDLVNCQGILPNPEKGNKNNNYSRLSIETMQDKRQCNDVVKVLKEKSCQPRSLYSVKNTFHKVK